ncbi:MAG: hypothetical protein Kapaf2KO_11200 [Candidatus Kapaibacteriales bacterium]
MPHKGEKCIYCGSEKVIRNGKTASGSLRYKCKDCNKSWSENTETQDRPEISELVKMYLDGSSTRDLVPIYKSSPLRINQKIRQFLESCPNWEDFIDSTVPNRHSRVVYLIGKRFNCYNKETSCNTMYVAMAYDAYSSCVLGYEICNCGCDDVWEKLIDRMHSRGLAVDNFMTSQPHLIQPILKDTYPEAKVLSNVLRSLRQEELECCLAKIPIKYKLVNDTTKLYSSFQNQTLKRYVKEYSGESLQGFLTSHLNEYVASVDRKCKDKSNFRIEDLHQTFSQRFEKFHTIKSDPQPMVNGWIALHMTEDSQSGFSRYSYFAQKPLRIDLESFSGSKPPKAYNHSSESDKKAEAFILEASTRVLQLPLTEVRCSLNEDLCEYIQPNMAQKKITIQV